MYRLFDFIVRFKDYVALILLVILSFVMMSFSNVAQLGGFRTIVVGCKMCLHGYLTPWR